ncbi:ATP-dependent Clp protease adapter protein CLPS1, chloroplastic [Lathyrus oleraceus]|uniref:ATP-dependent Clp protease adapter protein CLPS1 n=1 Tax=Pisum sativum TaxID=3888 RepID=A0A9D4YLE3_PEA|nr:ATP-dependent Clp protease adapter protein CLPS1, chloroplastic-like [Pisum sativum]KAI5441797.1 ATP-dependent Clp protease adapter protein CLPS1 [Pisum sativum]
MVTTRQHYFIIKNYRCDLVLLLLPSATATAQIGKLKTMKAMKASLHITTPFALISPNQLLNAITLGDKYFGFKYSKDKSIVMTMVATGLGKGGGLLEKPPTIETTSPGRESEFDLRKSRKTSPPYRVMLHNDNYNKREYVVQVLMKVIPGMTVDIAVNIMQEAHYNGLAVVIICAQVDAEDHCLQLRGNGLLSSIEPADGGC